eukprot:TRINITY_DN7988_c0_g1_i1.p1 TRINITY_DN7988_c0_g1~~TRINITY_DN7988_c0_g1_i1.p1  ORF type:complete len:107 (-),score=26.23 TRINITY_DN7988_c0_g1_i1:49-369(-)
MTHYHPADSRDVYSEEQQRRLQSYDERKPEDDVKNFFAAKKERKADVDPKSVLVYQKPAAPTPVKQETQTPQTDAGGSSGLRFCTGCGVLTQPQWKFCNKCGAKQE